LVSPIVDRDTFFGKFPILIINTSPPPPPPPKYQIIYNYNLNLIKYNLIS